MRPSLMLAFRVPANHPNSFRHYCVFEVRCIGMYLGHSASNLCYAAATGLSLHPNACRSERNWNRLRCPSCSAGIAQATAHLHMELRIPGGGCRSAGVCEPAFLCATLVLEKSLPLAFKPGVLASKPVRASFPFFPQAPTVCIRYPEMKKADPHLSFPAPLDLLTHPSVPPFAADSARDLGYRSRAAAQTGWRLLPLVPGHHSACSRLSGMTAIYTPSLHKTTHLGW